MCGVKGSNSKIKLLFTKINKFILLYSLKKIKQSNMNYKYPVPTLIMCSMKTVAIKSLVLAFTGATFMACGVESEEIVQPMHAEKILNYGTMPGSTILDFDETPGYADKTYALVNSIKTAINVSAKRRLANGTYQNENAALLLDTSKPGQKNGGLVTPSYPNSVRPMGNVLTVGKGNGNGASLYDNGGVIEVDFASVGTVVMRGLHVLDIDEDEAGSTLELLDASGRVIATYALPVTGAGGTSPLLTGDVAGVSKLRVNFISTNKKGGSGAIDVIQFCPGNKCAS